MKDKNYSNNELKFIIFLNNYYCYTNVKRTWMAIYIVVANPIPQTRPLAGWGKTTTAYTIVWIILQATNSLIRLDAINTFGLVNKYPKQTIIKNGIFSKSLRWALKIKIKINLKL